MSKSTSIRSGRVQRPVGALSPTASTESRRAAAQEALERDLYSFFEFDPATALILNGTVEVPYDDERGMTRIHTPALLIHFHPLPNSSDLPLSLMADICPQIKLRNPTARARKQAAACDDFASARGWRYRIFGDSEIRTTASRNHRFLLPYARWVPDTELKQVILTRLDSLEPVTIHELVSAIHRDKWTRAGLLPFVWGLVANGDIFVDMSEPLTANSRIHRNASRSA